MTESELYKELGILTKDKDKSKESIQALCTRWRKEFTGTKKL